MPPRLCTTGLLLAIVMTALSAGCAKNDAVNSLNSAPNAEQMQAQKQAGEAAAAAAKAQGEAAKAAAQARAGGPH